MEKKNTLIPTLVIMIMKLNTDFCDTGVVVGLKNKYAMKASCFALVHIQTNTH